MEPVGDRDVNSQGDIGTLQLYLKLLKALRAEMPLEQKDRNTRTEILALFQSKQVPDSRGRRGTESWTVQGQLSVLLHSHCEKRPVHFGVLESPWGQD